MTRNCRAIPRMAFHTVRVPAMDSATIDRARARAAELFVESPDLFEHSARTARVATDLARRIPRSRATDVVAAAWLHDIGYATPAQRTGFHPLDGALFLMADHWPERIVRLVAHHSLAALEAPFYGVGHHLSVIEVVSGVDAEILTTADLLAGPGNPAPSADARIQALRISDAATGLVPEDVREARYAGLLAARDRIATLT